jgi:metallophosphoesterase superfamily enzyme
MRERCAWLPTGKHTSPSLMKIVESYEPKRVINTGDAGDELTAENDVWV